MAISLGIRAAGNKKADIMFAKKKEEIKGSHFGSAACCIWAAPASKAPALCSASNSAKY